MKKTLNIDIDPAIMATVAATLKPGELGRLFCALAARMGGADADQYLNNSGLRLAFALLSPAIDESLQRQALNRANGAKGGRPRKHQPPAPPPTVLNISENSENSESPGFPLVSTKKSQKEYLPPTPPIEEKIKKKIILTPSQSACASEEKWTIPASQVVLEWEDLQRQMLHEQPWLNELCMSRCIRAEEMKLYVADFIKYLRERDLKETLPHAKAHFVNQLPYIIKIYKSNQDNHENSQKFIADPVARRQSERESRRQAVCRAIAGLATSSQQPASNPF